MTNRASGEKATVHTSTGPDSMVETFSPEATSHRRMLESRELEATTGNRGYTIKSRMKLGFYFVFVFILNIYAIFFIVKNIGKEFLEQVL